MPDLGIFVIGAFVTAVTLIACIQVGRAEEQDERDRIKER